MPSSANINTEAALAAYERGYVPIPIRDGTKQPYGHGWTNIRWSEAALVKSGFDDWAKQGASGVGLLTGSPSGGLIDVDIDNISASRLRRRLLPVTPMVTGRPGNRSSHYWYRATGEIPSSRTYKMPDGTMGVELRSKGGQTLIPPSVHTSGEAYVWEKEPWGGESGPLEIDGTTLAVIVGVLGLGAVLIDNWPAKGGRHEAYLALAGGLLRYGDGVHPYWEKNLPAIIEAIAAATRDEDGPKARVSEVMKTTLDRLREPEGKAVGFPKLAEIIGNDHAELARRYVKDIEQMGWRSKVVEVAHQGAVGGTRTLTVVDPNVIPSMLPPEHRSPITERINSWEALDLEPYLSGQVVMPAPAILKRSDGQGLMYPGRVNSLYGRSESAKSWIALYACLQEIALNGRVVFIDLEDGPEGTIDRAMRLGAGREDLQQRFKYVLPDGPLAHMERGKYGRAVTAEGERNASAFDAMLAEFDPTLIVADGMTVLYGLHGHDTNEATATEIITGWLKGLCRAGQATVIVIDHTGKGESPGASPIGAHHKVAMVQGTALRVEVLDRPMPGAVGRVKLVVFKDRPGAVRRISSKGKEQIAGVVTIDSSEDGITRLVIDPPRVPEPGEAGMEDEATEKALEAYIHEPRVLAILADGERHTTTEVAKIIGVETADLYALWRTLEISGVVEQSGGKRYTYYKLTTPPTPPPSPPT